MFPPIPDSPEAIQAAMQRHPAGRTPAPYKAAPGWHAAPGVGGTHHVPTVQVQSKHYRWYFPRHGVAWWLFIGWWWAIMVWPIQWAFRVMRPSTYMPSTYRRSTAKPAFVSEKRYRRMTR
jgi:hypothetical protein